MSGLIQTIDHPLEPLGDQLLDDLDEAIGLTVPEGAICAMIQAQTKNVRLRDSGEDPDASTGLLLTADGSPLWYTADLNAVRLIEVEASAKVFVMYYGPVRATAI